MQKVFSMSVYRLGRRSGLIQTSQVSGYLQSACVRSAVPWKPGYEEQD